MNENNAQFYLELFSENKVPETAPKIKSINKKKKYYEMVHETVKHYGYDHASLMELLTLVAGPKVPETTIMELSMMGEKELMSISPKDIPGVGPTIAQRIRASIELGKRVIKNNSNDNFVMIKSPEDAADKLSWLSVENQEKFVVLFLNTKNRVIAERTIFTGGLNVSIVHPREVFNQALKLSAATIIVSHNHPSGDPKPSREDIEVTKRLVEVGKIVGIEVLDHIIIGSSGKHCSLKEKGYV